MSLRGGEAAFSPEPSISTWHNLHLRAQERYKKQKLMDAVGNIIAAAPSALADLPNSKSERAGSGRALRALNDPSEKINRTAERLERQMSRHVPLHRRPKRQGDGLLADELARCQPLSSSLLRRLRRLYEPGRRSPARDRLILSNLWRVAFVADRYRHRGVRWEDLIQEGGCAA